MMFWNKVSLKKKEYLIDLDKVKTVDDLKVILLGEVMMRSWPRAPFVMKLRPGMLGDQPLWLKAIERLSVDPAQDRQKHD